MAKAKKTVEDTFEVGKKVKRIDIFRLFDKTELTWKAWDKKKNNWKKVPYKSKIGDVKFVITKREEKESGYILLEAESEQWKLRWLKKPKNLGWGFLTALDKNLLKDNEMLK